MERNIKTSGDFLTPLGSLNDVCAQIENAGASVTVGPSTDRPADPSAGDLFFDQTINSLLAYDGTGWQRATPDDVAILEQLVLKDKVTDGEVVISVRDGALTVTNPFTESISTIDLGGTTPDPGKIRNVFLNGTGRYSVGQSTLLNVNGLITLEYINSPGQFFVIEDVDGGNFGPGDRQGFGLVAEDIVDGTNLRGGLAPLTTGNSGGWSWQYTWYYTGGFPYAWTTYVTSNQTPGAAGGSLTGTFFNQIYQRQWWDLCGRAGVGKKMRWGIANGTLTDQANRDWSNRLVCQMYVAQEMIEHPDSSLLPTEVRNNGAGWYTYAVSASDYENLGQFPNGQDKGYRFRWSTFGNTTLNQLPYVSGVSTNDQITAASGLSHYVVYNCDPADINAANSNLAQGLIGPNNRLWPENTTVSLLQFNNPYSFANTPSENVYELSYSYLGAVQASPLFNQYQISTVEEITNTAISVAPLEKLHSEVCNEILQAVTAYYLVRDFNSAETAAINGLLEDALQAALSGQLITTFDAVAVVATDDTLFPAALKEAILSKLEFWMNTLPDN